MNNKPKSYTNGRGEEICTSCTKQIVYGYCDCNNIERERRMQIPFGKNIPAPGDRLELVDPKTKMEFTAEVFKVSNPKWWRNTMGLQGVEIRVSYKITEVTKPPRAKLSIVKRR